MTYPRIAIAGVVVGALVLACATAATAQPALDQTEIVSAGVGAAANASSYDPAISADGRYVVFSSIASNLVGGDTNGAYDVFWVDTVAGVTQRVSVGPGGTQGNSSSYVPSVSADGRYVAYESTANNLVPGDTNASADVFRYDTVAGVTERLSLAADGTQGNDSSYSPTISADGRYTAFTSDASNLVSDDNNAAPDVFRFDATSSAESRLRRVSVRSNGTESDGGGFSPAISADGRIIAYASNSTDLVAGDTNGWADIYRVDVNTGTVARVSKAGSVQGDASSLHPAISASGRFVAFDSESGSFVGGDTNGESDVFRVDTSNASITRVSVASDGTQATGASYRPSLSSDGRYVAFDSFAPNLVSGDTNGWSDVFRRDAVGAVTERASVSSGGAEGDDGSAHASLSSDGGFLAFYSGASSLASNDVNAQVDIFVHRSRIDTDATTPVKSHDPVTSQNPAPTTPTADPTPVTEPTPPTPATLQAAPKLTSRITAKYTGVRAITSGRKGGRITVTIAVGGAVATGKVVVYDTVKHARATTKTKLIVKTITARQKGRVTFTLPKLKPATHRITVGYLGTGTIAAANTAPRKFVVRAR